MFFNKNKKKKDNGINKVIESLKIPEEKQFDGTSVERDLIQNVAICMNAMNITKTPILKFLYEDQGIFESIYKFKMNDLKMNLFKEAYGAGPYLVSLASDALGSGIYVMLSQNKYKKPVKDYTADEVKEVVSTLNQNNPYELAVKELNIEEDENNKKCLKQILLLSFDSYKKATGTKALDKDCLKILMKVLYNAGVTIVIRD